jgi:hypothetical protein
MLSGDCRKWGHEQVPGRRIKKSNSTFSHEMVVFLLPYLNGRLCESRWVFPELLKSAPSAPLPTSSSGTLNIRDSWTRARSIGFPPTAFTYFGIAMQTCTGISLLRLQIG